MKVIDDLRWRQIMQVVEAVSAYNRWLTGVKVRHDPTVEECITHYIRDGGAADFARREEEERRSRQINEAEIVAS